MSSTGGQSGHTGVTTLDLVPLAFLLLYRPDQLTSTVHPEPQNNFFLRQVGEADFDWSVLVAGPTLPTELVAKIIARAVAAPQFNFLQADWANGVQTSTLYRLCLTSRMMNQIASPLLYRHLVLPMPKAGAAFIRTLKSARWNRGERAGKAVEWVRAISFGVGVEAGEEEDGEFVGRVLAKLGQAQVDRVAVTGIKLDITALGKMSGKTLVPIRRLAHSMLT